MITIKEIAARLNLSTTTVSNVINGKNGEVSPETLAKVKAFLQEVGYVPNQSAVNLAQNKSKIIGVVLKAMEYRYMEQLSDPFVSEMVSGIEQAIRRAGYYMMLYLSDDIDQILAHVSTWNVDGLLLFCLVDDDGRKIREKYHKPMVFIDCFGEGMEECVTVGTADEKAGYEATRYLLEQGHRRIAFLCDQRVGPDLERFWGYQRALSEAGAAYEESLFFRMRTAREELEESLRELCGRARDVSAVFCGSDLCAVLYMAALEDQGIRVPRDLSVVGFDDNYFAKTHRPALTTLHQEPFQKGTLAVELLIQMLSGKKVRERHVVLEASLVERQTVRKISEEEA